MPDASRALSKGRSHSDDLNRDNHSVGPAAQKPKDHRNHIFRRSLWIRATLPEAVHPWFAIQRLSSERCAGLQDAARIAPMPKRSIFLEENRSSAQYEYPSLARTEFHTTFRAVVVTE